MANTKISQLPAASLPLSGNEEIPMVQAGVTVRASADAVSDTVLAEFAANDGSSLVGYQPSGTGAVATTVQTKLRESVSVKDFGAVGDGTTDDTAAIQAAIDACAAGGPSNQPGGQVFFPRGTYLVNTPINLTTSNSVLRAYIQLVGEGNGTVIKGNTGGRLFDCVGTNFLMFRDFYVVADANNPSTIIFQFARSTGTWNFCHHNRIVNVTVNIPSIHTANNGFGTIGLVNVEGEDFTTHDFYSSANSPIVLLRAPAADVLLNLTSYVPIDTVGVSFGQVTFSGKTLMQAWNAWCPPLHIDAVNSCTFENAHWAGGTSPWGDGDTTGTWEYAIRTGASNPINTCNFYGLVESHKKFLFAQANIENSTMRAVVSGYSATAGDPLVNTQANALLQSRVSMFHGDVARRPLITGTGLISDCSLSGYNTSDTLESTLAVQALNTDYSNDRVAVTYGRWTQEKKLATIPITVNTPGVVVASINLPTIDVNYNAGYVSVKIEGVLTTFGSKNQAAAPSLARFTSYIDLVSDLNGNYTIGTPVTTLSTPVSGDAPAAAITTLTFTAAVVANVLQITASGTASGTSAYTNGVNLTGTASLEWRGFSGNEGVVFK